jgi:hypothetical protein
MTPLARLGGISIDCAAPRTLAAFYHELTGWPVSYDSDDYVALDTGADTGTSGHPLGVDFQRVADYQPLAWPDGNLPAQAHLDFYVLDPAGHPFCIIVSGASDEDSGD